MGVPLRSVDSGLPGLGDAVAQGMLPWCGLSAPGVEVGAASGRVCGPQGPPCPEADALFSLFRPRLP